MRKAAHGRGKRKQEDRPDIILLPADFFGEEAGHGDDDDVGDSIGGDYPGGIFEGGAQVAAHGIDGYVNDGGIDQLDDGRGDNGNNDDPFSETGFQFW